MGMSLRVQHDIHKGMSLCVLHGMSLCVQHGMSLCMQHSMSLCVQHGIHRSPENCSSLSITIKYS